MRKTLSLIMILFPVMALAQPAAVDLGLSVKWAACNLGADVPEASGEYYAWAEAAPKQEYSWDSYAWGRDTWESLTKYNAGFRLGYLMEKEDDAAAAALGAGWRIPTDPEWRELLSECDWTWCSQGGVNGYKVSSRSGSASIFLPAAGYKDERGLVHEGTDGRYWSATRHPYHPVCAMNLFFNSDYRYQYFYRRYRGYSIRPVCE